MKGLLVNLSLLAASVLLTLTGAEVAARIYSREFRCVNFLQAKRNLIRSAYPAQFDEQLGWVPEQGVSTRNFWDTRVTIGPDGIRANGGTPPPEPRETILAVGDSFTFGDQVSDDQTWPAILERISGARVLNGGVFGYGIDQSYLRLLRLAAKYRPGVVVLSFIPDDVRRSELSERSSVTKPYFDLAPGGELVLRTSHIRPPPAADPSLGLLRDLLGYSFLAHKLMSRGLPDYWVEVRSKSTRAHARGEEVACGILQRLTRDPVLENLQIYLLLQVADEADERRLDEESGKVDLDKVSSCLDRQAVQLVDMRDRLRELRRSDRPRYETLYQGHMTAAGNEFVAETLWQAMLSPPG